MKLHQSDTGHIDLFLAENGTRYKRIAWNNVGYDSARIEWWKREGSDEWERILPVSDEDLFIKLEEQYNTS